MTVTARAGTLPEGVTRPSGISSYPEPLVFRSFLFRDTTFTDHGRADQRSCPFPCRSMLSPGELRPDGGRPPVPSARPLYRVKNRERLFAQFRFLLRRLNRWEGHLVIFGHPFQIRLEVGPVGVFFSFPDRPSLGGFGRHGFFSSANVGQTFWKCPDFRIGCHFRQIWDGSISWAIWRSKNDR